jgi:uncharacterized protein with FMN-binding domain
VKRTAIGSIVAKVMIGTAALAFAATILSGCATREAKYEYYASLTVNDPDLASLTDGAYKGSHSLKPPRGVYVPNSQVDVAVRIADHRYADIAILTKSVAGWPHLAKLRDLVIERQTLQVDALSGATSLTGKAYLMAIENAVSKDR